MALVVENGTGMAGAESFASVAAYKARCDGRGVSYAGRTDEQIEQDLRKATDYMVEVYRMAWAGERVSATQALDWPRNLVPMRDGPGGWGGSGGYYPSNSVPGEVVAACIDLAVKAATVDLAPDETQLVKRKKVGPVEVEYQDYSPQTRRYVAIDRRLAPLLDNAGGARMRRA